MNQSIPKYESIELEITDLAYGGKGVAKYNDFVIFVDYGLPGQKVKAKIRKKKRHYAEARIEEILVPSSEQINPPCPWFGVCGGCKWQHLNYSAQIEAKRKQVEDLLHRIGHLKDIQVLPVLPAKEIYGYRNKMDFTFSNRRWILDDEPEDADQDFALGMHVPGRFDKIIQIDNCMLQSDACNTLLKACSDWIRESGLPAYDPKSHQGFWRFLVMREGSNTDERMFNFITSGQFGEEGKKEVKRLAEFLDEQDVPIHSILHSMTDRLSEVAFGDQEILLKGKSNIRDTLKEKTFEISSNAFFQTNTRQAELLFQTLLDLAEFDGSEIVYDLYCGTGAIGIFIGDKVKNIIGIEVIEQAIEDAKRNALLNGLSNIEFILADMKDALKETEEIIEKHGQPDVIILDPPRGGTHPKTVKHLLKIEAPKIIYVSCNPSILARDLAILCEEMYSVKTIQPVDMFPHTPHIEVVAVLEKK